jgi:predicted phosphohydrolase
MLRSAAFVVLSGLLVWVVVVEEGPNDLGAIGSLLGAMMVLLGFAALIQWPPKR